MDSKRTLVTGATGFIGLNLVEELLSRSRIVYSTSRSKSLTKAQHVILDIRNQKDLCDYLKYTKPEVIYHTAAISDINNAETDRTITYQVNVEATKTIAKWCQINGAKLVYFSTDFVFDGSANTVLSEQASPNPISYYGETKLLGEKEVQRNLEDYVIIRPVMVYGQVREGQRLNFPIWLLNNGSRQLNITGDQIRNPVHIDDLVSAAIALEESRHQGVFHVAGPEPISVFEFAKKVFKEFELPVQNLTKINTSDLEAKALRPLYSVLSINKAKEQIDYDPVEITKGLKRLKPRNERRQA